MRRGKPFVAPLSERQLRAEAERLVCSGKMPSLEKLSAAVLETRKKYATRIRRARREYRAKVSIN
jgi:hypothetical protein